MGMANLELTVEKRTETGKSYARKLRAAGKIPAVVYGSGEPAINVEVSVREAERILSAAGSLVTLAINGDSKPVIVKDILRDPVRGDLMHVDFHAVDLKKELEISVPIRYVGEENRGNDGGIVATLLWEVTVSCLPTQIPEAIEVDVSGLTLDDTLTLADLELPEGVEVVGEPDEAVVRVTLPDLPAAEEGDEEEAEDGAAEAEEPAAEEPSEE